MNLRKRTCGPGLLQRLVRRLGVAVHAMTTDTPNGTSSAANNSKLVCGT